MASHCWAKTEKEKYDDVDNQIMGAALYGEVQEEKNEEDPE